MANAPAEAARQQAINALEAKRSEAESRSHDRYWSRPGGANVQQWVARAYSLAISSLKESAPEEAETPAHYLSRVAEGVRQARENGPDLDDESWFASAIDEAVMIIGAAGQS